MTRPTNAAIGLMLGAAMAGLLIAGSELGRDVLVHALTLSCFVVAVIFQRRVLRTDGAWLPFSTVVLLVAIFALLMRFWDLAAELPDLAVPVAGDLAAFELGTKYGERVAFVAVGCFLVLAVRRLHARQLQEVSKSNDSVQVNVPL